MKQSTIFILTVIGALSTAAAAADDQKCKNDFQSFLACVKKQYEQRPESEKQAAKKARQDKSGACFTQASCDAPNWNADPMGGAGKHGGGMQMPEAVKQCLKKKMAQKVGAKLNECLARKGVNSVNFTALADNLDGSGLIETQGGGGAGKDGIQGAMVAKFNVVKAVDKCAQKKGGDTNAVKPLEQCLQNVKKEEKPKICAFIKPCADKGSVDCKQRAQDVRKALCQCKKEKERDIAQKLRTLAQQQGQQKIGIQQLVKTVADDQDVQDMMEQVDACYTEANEPEPPILKLAMKMMSGGGSAGAGGAGAGGAGGLGAAFSVKASTVVIMADMLTLDADDPSECEPCA